MRAGILTALGLAAGLAAGCNTAVGNYFANRGRDLGECFRGELGVGLGIGGGVRGAGLADVGLGFGGISRTTGIGWVYGDGFAFSADKVQGHATSDFEVWLPFYHRSADNSALGMHLQRLGGRQHDCFWLLPAAFHSINDRVSSTLRYSPWSPKVNDAHVAWARVHAFDVEVSAYALLIGVKVGFSPGEFVDFLLGWFGLDIAGDDRAWKPPLAPE